MTGSAPTRAVLAVDKSRAAIVETVFEHRVTIILGSTGCGKSSRVPQFLLEDLGGPILCTQPRRLAVVSIAKRVAEELGGDPDQVGYRIGQRPCYTNRTRIVFATAGVLLEDLKGQGAQALLRYKAILLDEVHERSVESDLVLACVRELMTQHRKMKLVLMSATCDVPTYAEYFRAVADGRVARVQLTDLGFSIQTLLLSTEVKYLEEVLKLLGQPPKAGGPATPRSTLDSGPASRPSSVSDGEGSGGGGLEQYRELVEQYKRSPQKMEGRLGDADQLLVRDLVVRLHATEPDLGAALLVFLPTYRTLELQHELLLATGLPLAVFALHSSIDIYECVAAMEAAQLRGRRKVILATNIAESSVTIPAVKHVVDACRTLQIRWDRVARRTESRLVYASRSQCDQRKGRTGRTCSGVCYRLLPRRVFLEQLSPHECPTLTLLHLRRESLGLLCATNPLLASPPALLAKCLSAPMPETATDALQFLASAGAATRAAATPAGYQPSAYGRLLAAMPVSIEAAQLVAHGGRAGLLRPAVLLAALLNVAPLPIHQPFASAEQYRQNLRRYGHPDAQPSNPQAVLLANLAAFEFWQRAWCDPRRIQRLRRLAAGVGSEVSSEAGGADADASLLLPGADAEEGEWCGRHQLIAGALHDVAELAQAIQAVLHIHRPDFLHKSCRPPPAGGAAPGPHTCRLVPAARRWGTDAGVEASSQQCASDAARLTDFYPGQACRTLAQLLLVKDVDPAQLATGLGPASGAGWRRPAPLCRFFLSGRGCSRGDACAFSHDPLAQVDPELLAALRRPVVFSLATFTLGSVSGAGKAAPAPFAFSGSDSVLLLGEGDLSFTEALAALTPAALVASVQPSRPQLLRAHPGCAARLARLEAAAAVPNTRLRLLFGVDAAALHALGRPGCDVAAAPAAAAPAASGWRVRDATHVVFNFPHSREDEDDEGHRQLMAAFLSSLAAAMLLRSGSDASGGGEERQQRGAVLLLTLCNDQWSRWQVEASARDAFFFLEGLAPFPAEAFQGYNPRRGHSDEAFPFSGALTYTLVFRPPRGQHGVVETAAARGGVASAQRRPQLHELASWLSQVALGSSHLQAVD